MRRQRTTLVNALGAHLAEFGVVAPAGLRNVSRLIAVVCDARDRRLPDLARPRRHRCFSCRPEPAPEQAVLE
jgi:transposase